MTRPQRPSGRSFTVFRSGYSLRRPRPGPASRVASYPGFALLSLRSRIRARYALPRPPLGTPLRAVNGLPDLHTFNKGDFTVKAGGARRLRKKGPRGFVRVSMKRQFSRNRDGDVQVGSGPGRRKELPQRTETIPEAPPQPSDRSTARGPFGRRQRGRRKILTFLRNPSPMLSLVTPGVSLATMWMMRRSYGFMRSRISSRPVSDTCRATLWA